MDLSGVKGADTSNLSKNPVYVDGSVTEELSNMNDAANQLYNTFKRFDDFEEMNFGEQFFTVTDAIFSTVDAINKFGSAFESMIELIELFKTIS